jgi:DNA-binding GntR family transcriptional regulator
MAAACRDMLHAVADGRLVEALEHDEATLRVLYEAGGNPVLMSVIDTLWMQCRPYKVLGANEAQNNADPTLWTHQPLLTEAARTGDVETAVSLTEKSLVSARRRLERRLIAQTEGN